MKKILFLLFLFTFNQSNACMCTAIPAIEKEFNYSSHVFIGKVIELSKYDKIYLLGENNHSQYLLVEIIRDFKGFQNDTKFITLLNCENSCSRDYSVGKKYIFYCNSIMGSEFLLAPGICSRTMSEHSDDYEKEINSLSKFKNPDENNSFKGYRTIESEELDSLRNDNALYHKKLLGNQKKDNEKTYLLIICIILSLAVLLMVFTKRIK